MELLGIKFVKVFPLIAGIGFVINFLWENVQMPLYQGTTNFWQHQSICFLSSLGDMLILLVLYGVIAIIRKDIQWVTNMSIPNIITLIVLGGGVAIGIEAWALQIGKWNYTSAMPLLSYTHIGLTPVLQMVTLPIVTFYISQLIMKKYYVRS